MINLNNGEKVMLDIIEKYAREISEIYDQYKASEIRNIYFLDMANIAFKLLEYIREKEGEK